jgi:hypothetical protein
MRCANNCLRRVAQRPNEESTATGKLRATMARRAMRKESADKPGSVVDSHSSGERVTAPLKRPTRKPCGPHVAACAACFPIWSCSRWGLPCRRVLPPARCALTAPFHPCRRSRERLGGVFSVALSVGSRPPGVTWHLALGARTFLRTLTRAATAWPTPARTIGERNQGFQSRSRGMSQDRDFPSASAAL